MESIMIYLDNAATSWPKPKTVIQAIVDTIQKHGANPGRSGHKMSVSAGRIILQTRELLCSLFHVDDPFQFIFCSNCTDALNLAIKGCLKKGDHVITTSLEHNSVLRPLKAMEQQGKITVTILPLSNEKVATPDQVQKAILSNTRMVIASHASNVTGLIQPIELIGNVCKKRNILFLVDGAQTAGTIPIDLGKLPIDLFAFPGHKGLMGPQGTGALYIRPGIIINQLKEGGTGTDSFSLYQPADLPERYESGTLNTPGIAGLGAGINYILQHQEELQYKENNLIDSLYHEIENIKGINLLSGGLEKPHTGVLSMNIQEYPSGAIADILDLKYDIACRAGLHCAPLIHKSLGTISQGAIRFSVSIFNTKKEIYQCIKALNEIVSSLKRS